MTKEKRTQVRKSLDEVRAHLDAIAAAEREIARLDAQRREPRTKSQSRSSVL